MTRLRVRAVAIDHLWLDIEVPNGITAEQVDDFLRLNADYFLGSMNEEQQDFYFTPTEAVPAAPDEPAWDCRDIDWPKAVAS